MKNITSTVAKGCLTAALTIAAQSALAEKLEGQLKIDSVWVNFATESLTIKGQKFNLGNGPLVVTLGNSVPLEITNVTATEIDVNCPVIGNLPRCVDGDYLLSVSKGHDESQRDWYDLTIGAVGPSGPKGVPGATGPAGPAGANGATGPAGPAGANGATGPAGPAGANGAAGPAGPAGANNLFGTNTSLAVEGHGRDCTLGEIILTAGGVANGLPAQGQILLINQNTPLFSLLGTTYGGNGIQTFQLPDLRAVAPNGLTYSICTQGIFPSRN